MLNLKVLDLSFSANLEQVTVGTIAKTLTHSLKSLKLNFCPKLELFQTLNAISEMNYLTDLNLDEINCSEAALAELDFALKKNVYLRSLTLSWSLSFSDPMLLEIGSACLNLSSLDLSWCNKVTLECVKNVCIYNRNLFRIKMAGQKKDAAAYRYLTTLMGNSIMLY